MKPPFTYFGGKTGMADLIVSMLPPHHVATASPATRTPARRSATSHRRPSPPRPWAATASRSPSADVDDPAPRQWRLTIPGAPLTINEQRRTRDRYAIARETANYRRQGLALGYELTQAGLRGVPAVRIHAIHERLNRRSIPDVAACMPAVKPVIDGLVDAGCFPDDGPDIVRELAFSVRVTGRAALTLEITEALPAHQET